MVQEEKTIDYNFVSERQYKEALINAKASWRKQVRKSHGCSPKNYKYKTIAKIS